MKKVSLLHNPTAGDNEFSEKELVKLLKKEGFEYSYASVQDEGWSKLDEDSDFLAIAGGDGTIRRVVKALMKRRLIDKQYPIALLPHGTANNIATSLGITGNAGEIMASWHNHRLQPFDIGRVTGLNETLFFLEAFGIGIFPKLMKEMEKVDDEGESADERLNAARKVLLDIVKNYEAKECRLTADGEEHNGKYLMLELMNIRSLGPNLVLAPDADPGDGCFEITLIPEDHREKFASFLEQRIQGEEVEYAFSTFRAKKITIECDCADLHIDDELIKNKNDAAISIEMMHSLLQFVVSE